MTAVLVVALTLPAQLVKVLGGTAYDPGRGIVRTADGGYVLNGWYESCCSGSNDMFFTKMDATGAFQWGYAVGSSQSDAGFEVIETSDGGLLLGGYTTYWAWVAGDNDMFLVKTDNLGNLQWSTVLGGGILERVNRLIQTADGGYFAVGLTSSFGEGSWGSYDIYGVKLDSGGDVQWARTVATGADDRGTAVVQTPSGDILVGGKSGSSGQLLRFDTTGGLVWSATVEQMEIHDLALTGDGGFVAAGMTGSLGAGGLDFALAKFDAGGNFQWMRTAGGSSDERFHSLVLDTDGGFVLSGRCQSWGAGGDDVFLVKFNAGGGFLWATYFGGPNYEWVQKVIATPGGYAAVGGTTSYGSGSIDYLFATFDGSGNNCLTQPVSPAIGSPAPTITTPVPRIDTTMPTVSHPVPTVTPHTPVEFELCPTGIQVGEVSGRAAGGLSVRNVPGGLCLLSPAPLRVELYDVGGRLAGSFALEQEHTVSLKPGVYFITGGEKPLKAVVR